MAPCPKPDDKDKCLPFMIVNNLSTTPHSSKGALTKDCVDEECAEVTPRLDKLNERRRTATEVLKDKEGIYLMVRKLNAGPFKSLVDLGEAVLGKLTPTFPRQEGWLRHFALMFRVAYADSVRSVITEFDKEGAHFYLKGPTVLEDEGYEFFWVGSFKGGDTKELREVARELAGVNGSYWCPCHYHPIWKNCLTYLFAFLNALKNKKPIENEFRFSQCQSD